MEHAPTSLPDPAFFSPESVDATVTLQTFQLEDTILTGTYAVFRANGAGGLTDVWMDAAEYPDRPSPPGEREAASPIRVLLVILEPIMRLGLETVLAEETGFEVVGVASRGEDALALARDLAPDLVVLELHLPDQSGFAVIEALSRTGSSARPVLLVPSISEREFIRARQLGVRGVVLTSMPPHLLAQCLRTVHAGDEFLEKATLIKTLTALTAGSERGDSSGDALTEREKAVAELVAGGLSNHEIARRLNVSAGTVKSHLQNIYDKLGVESRTAAVMRASAR
jgi:DNA-binding NarL/FixJ family response regulator